MSTQHKTLHTRESLLIGAFTFRMSCQVTIVYGSVWTGPVQSGFASFVEMIKCLKEMVTFHLIFLLSSFWNVCFLCCSVVNYVVMLCMLPSLLEWHGVLNCLSDFASGRTRFLSVVLNAFHKDEQSNQETDIIKLKSLFVCLYAIISGNNGPMPRNYFDVSKPIQGRLYTMTLSSIGVDQ